MESSSESNSEEPTIMNSIAEPLLKEVCNKDVDLKRFVGENSANYINGCVVDLDRKQAINLYSDLQAITHDFGTLSDELRNLQRVLKTKIRSKRTENTKTLQSKMDSKYVWKQDNKGVVRRYRRKKSQVAQPDKIQLESYSDSVSDVLVLDTTSGNEENNKNNEDNDKTIQSGGEEADENADEGDVGNDGDGTDSIAENKDQEKDNVNKKHTNDTTHGAKRNKDENVESLKKRPVITDSRSSKDTSVCNTTQELAKCNEKPNVI